MDYTHELRRTLFPLIQIKPGGTLSAGQQQPGLALGGGGQPGYCSGFPLFSLALGLLGCASVPMLCWRLTDTALIYDLAWHLSKHQLLFPLHHDFHDV